MDEHTQRQVGRIALFMLPVLPIVLLAVLAAWIWIAIDIGFFAGKRLILGEDA